MFQRLHDDFGGGKILSITPSGDKLAMIIDNGLGLTGTFEFTFEKTKPYLIDGLSIQAGN